MHRISAKVLDFARSQPLTSIKYVAHVDFFLQTVPTITLERGREGKKYTHPTRK